MWGLLIPQTHLLANKFLHGALLIFTVYLDGLRCWGHPNLVAQSAEMTHPDLGAY